MEWRNHIWSQRGSLVTPLLDLVDKSPKKLESWGNVRSLSSSLHFSKTNTPDVDRIVPTYKRF